MACLEISTGPELGGALGAKIPWHGTVAMFSNSAGFTTTIAHCVAIDGWGTLHTCAT